MQTRIDSLAQQVEHNTFNVGVLGSSPKRITKKERHVEWLSFFCFNGFCNWLSGVKVKNNSAVFLCDLKILYICLTLKEKRKY